MPNVMFYQLFGCKKWVSGTPNKFSSKCKSVYSDYLRQMLASFTTV